MRKHDSPTADEVRRFYSYNPDTGALIRTCSRGRTKGGTEVLGTVNGYITLVINGRRFLGHRIAWLLMTGRWPAHEIDHKNMIRLDNRWENLREATSSQNKFNSCRKARKNSKWKGVKPAHQPGNKWTASIHYKKVGTHLGTFDCPAAAHFAYAVRAAQLCGEFARTV